MKKTTNVLTVRNGKLTNVSVKGTCSVEWGNNYIKNSTKDKTVEKK